MSLKIKKIIKSLVPEDVRLLTTPYRRQFNNFKTLSLRYGQFNSMKAWVPIGPDKESIPWLTYPAIEYLNQFDFSKERVLEFGSGGSTIWWAQRVSQITCVEDNKIWYNKVQEKLKQYSNIECRYSPDEVTYAALNKSESFEIIVIDGNHRGSCAEAIVKNKENIEKHCKMLLVDNSDWLPGTISFLRDNLNWVQVDFMGFAPINGYCHATTLFLNPAKKFIRKTDICPIDGISKRFEHDLDYKPERSKTA